jgi:hypothetical protein
MEQNTLPAVVDTKIFMKDIVELDLSMIKLKLQDFEEGPGWSKELCNDTEVEYKKFLAMNRHYPGIDIVPNKLVDTFWHYHILDTQKYAEDCQEIFGHFLHHFPYFGMNGPQDKQNLIDAFVETQELYRIHFGRTQAGEATKCKKPKCRTACKPAKCK